MKQEQIQLTNDKKIYAKLDKITQLLEIMVTELEGEPHRLSKKAEKAIERGLRELKSGKYTEYKDFESFKRAFS